MESLKIMPRGKGGRAPSQRQLRVGEAIRHALSDIIQQAHFREPSLQDVSVTISEVRISPDLKNATIFFSPLQQGEDSPWPTDEIRAGLQRATGYLQRALAKKMALKYVPKLSFLYDASFDEAAHISRLLNDPRVRDDCAS